jgi:hypothetical protein
MARMTITMTRHDNDNKRKDTTMNNHELNRVFKAIRKKSKRVLTRGDVNMCQFGISVGWSIEKMAGKVNAGHGERWE